MYKKIITGYVVSDDLVIKSLGKKKIRFIKPKDSPWLFVSLRNLYGKFEYTSALVVDLCNRKLTPNATTKSSNKSSSELSEEISALLDNLFKESLFDYQNAVTSIILDNYYRTVYKIQSSDINPQIPNEIPIDLFEKYIEEFAQQEKDVSDKILDTVQNTDASQLTESLLKIFSELTSHLDDLIYQAGMDAQRLAYESEKITHYRFCATEDEHTCTICSELNGKVFPFLELENGVNFPEIHPRCRCETDIISDYDVDEFGYHNFLTNYAKDIKVDNNPFKTWYEAYFSKHATITVNGNKLIYNPKNLQGYAVLPDGRILNESKLVGIDKELLRLMRLRDETHDPDEKLSLILQMVKLMYDNSDAYTVDISKPYSYYTLTEDITDKLNRLMRDEEEKYGSPLNREGWIANIFQFISLVANKEKYDLKNIEAWQQSLLIYNGEIVDRDVAGNINYGYLGKVMGIPDSILLLGAGLAQISAGTSDINFVISIGDDPRDQIRVSQGIQHYYDLHPDEERW